MTDTIEAIASAEHPAQTEYLQTRDELRVFAKQGYLFSQTLAVFTIVRVLLNQEEGDAPEDLEQRALAKLMRAFQPITNAKKLANGRRRWDTLNGCLNRIEVSKDFGQFSCLNETTKEMVRAMAPRLKVALRSQKIASA